MASLHLHIFGMDWNLLSVIVVQYLGGHLILLCRVEFLHSAKKILYIMLFLGYCENFSLTTRIEDENILTGSKWSLGFRFNRILTTSKNPF